MTQPPVVTPYADTRETPAIKPRRRFSKLVFRVWVVLAILFAAYLLNSYRASGFDERVLTSDDNVIVAHTADTITFTPTGAARPAALIFIPGAMVDPAAYAPLAHFVAEHGHRVIMVKLSLRCAPLDSQREALSEQIKTIMQTGDTSTTWVVGGHSLGGVLACRIARDHGDLLSGLILIGTSHPRDFSLASVSFNVTKITGTNDGLASPSEDMANAAQLPANTRRVVIQGGNHSQFGYYGFQLGDHRATISRAEQQAQTLAAVLQALEAACPTH